MTTNTNNGNETHSLFNPKLDLTFERIVDVPKELVWRAWTEPALLKQWFCPLPWKTIDAEMDLRPGGMFRTTMQSPMAIVAVLKGSKDKK